MTDRIVILGAGTGGTLTANRLRKELKDVTITVVDENDRHVYQPGLLFVPFGLAKPEDIVEFISVAGLPARAVRTHWLDNYLRHLPKLQAAARKKLRCTLHFDCLIHKINVSAKP